MLQRVLSILFLALLLPAIGFAQENKISGRIVDEKSKEPIPFASIGLREEQTGALTNEYGYFQLAMPEKNPQDSLIINALGYFRKAVLIKPGIKVQDMIIEVPKRAIALKEVKVTSSAKIKNLDLGSKSTTPGEGMIQGMPGSQYAFFVKNDKGKNLGNVRSVSFYIGENGFPREPFRVRLYKADGNYNSPNTDLLTDNIVVSAPKGGEWYTIDLTQYNIEAPKEGFFVAMEWIVSGDKFYTTNFMDNYTPYGQILRPTFEFKESRTWNYTIGRGWSLITLASNGQRYNAMIRAEVDMIKD
ncbi:carboxypeptidase-like regulatory domain-containing protein [Hymenobacter taeanensis]|uniref:Carboxypeptidase-like regulatory domain-containing protein n=1 Tax=Hymenobacter taeanensis TaxID=2735321 RepID=A0A6M6BGG7_9BACT|nr:MULTISPECIES: carboxypeptidase-like regulatory domain-containing protein [Hymenobacter]QJX47120.1 carboxypeptidase-like regulatory domain-containing protein [Hymenobacter taeanensis]UOQ81035.1 carboxypeptidase-like regulatory domain-containing protein [Hymenobacter sp. 5414T-23]